MRSDGAERLAQEQRCSVKLKWKALLNSRVFGGLDCERPGSWQLPLLAHEGP